MLSPLPPSLQAEVDSSTSKTCIPGFVNLYLHLASTGSPILDISDGSTVFKNKEHDETNVSTQLEERHVEFTKDAILVRCLRDVACLEGTGLDMRERELCFLISTYLGLVLDGTMSIEEQKKAETLMEGEIEEFKDRMSLIVEVLAKHINELEGMVVKMIEPLVSTGPEHSLQSTTLPTTTTATTATSRIPKSQSHSTTTRKYQPPSLSSSSSQLLTTHTAQTHHLTKTHLPTLLHQIHQSLTTILKTQTSLQTALIRHAEVYTYSTLSRHIISNSTFQSVIAQGLQLKTQLWSLQREREISSIKGSREGLSRMMDELRKEEGELEGREIKLAALRAEYTRELASEVVKGDIEVWRVLGKEYKSVVGEIAVLKGDLERLEGEVERMDGGGRGR